METLPVELKQLILGALPNIDSLLSLIATCTSFRNAFLDAQGLILPHIIANQIDRHVLAEAIVILRGRSKPTPWSAEDITAALDTLFAAQTTVEQVWTLPDAIAVSALHRHVQHFASQFARVAIAQIPPCAGVEACAPLSVTERRRIERAFYRFELYRLFFRQPDGSRAMTLPLMRQWKLFFSRFSPWENLQLLCVHDYLFRRISIRM